MIRLLAALLFLPLAAQATIVTTVTDEDDGTLGGGTGISLREAVKYSPAADTITFAPALSGQTIHLILGEILISQSLTIDGSALPEKITLSGDETGDGPTSDDSGILRITAGTVLIDSLHLSGGYRRVGSFTRGAALYAFYTGAKLTILNSHFSGNSATEGGAIYFRGALNDPDSFLRIEGSNFTGNSSPGNGDGGAISTYGTSFLVNTTLASNTANDGGAVFSTGGSVQVNHSFFTGNSATSRGGAVYTSGGPLTVTGTTLAGNSADLGGAIATEFNSPFTMENSTITANFAKGPGGGSGGGIFLVGQPSSILHSTITGNTAVRGGGGVWRKSDEPLNIQKSIIAGNSAPSVPNIDVSREFTGSSNLFSGDPRLAALGDYGGPTQTMPPLPDSPAIDAAGSNTDQRGFPRVSNPDIGAAEYQGTSDLTRFWTLDFDGDTSPYGTEQALGTDPLVSDPASSRNITAPVLNASGHPVLSFGIGAAAPGTRWILCRSTDLLTFTEIYRYDGSTDTAALGITVLRTATGVTVTDTTPSPGAAFYRFEAVLGL
ncbi:MAG: choice-of-anchor Q domain-containing protein [Luteolibacter sp.]